MKTSQKWLWLYIFCIVCLIPACNLTRTISSPTPQPVLPSPTPTIEKPVSPPPQSVYFNDDFVDNSHSWSLFSNENARVDIDEDANALFIDFFQPNNFQSSWSANEYDSYTLETTICVDPNVAEANGGVTLYASDDYWWLLWVYPNSKQYSLKLYDNGVYTDLTNTPLVETNHIKPALMDGLNCIKLRVNNDNASWDGAVSNPYEDNYEKFCGGDSVGLTGRLGPSANAPSNDSTIVFFKDFNIRPYEPFPAEMSTSPDTQEPGASGGETGSTGNGPGATGNLAPPNPPLVNVADFASSLENNQFGLTGPSGINDKDYDGLSDEFERWIADEFFPYLYLDGSETESKYNIMRLYQVTPLTNASSNPIGEDNYFGPDGVLLTFVVLFEDDYGDRMTGLTDHDGDAELLRILFVPLPNDPYSWTPLVVVIKRHEDTPEAYYLGHLDWIDSHPIIWVSADKHAMYSDWEECDDYSSGFEYCGDSDELNYPVSLYVDGFNVGERRNPAFYLIPESSLNKFTNEYAWANPPYSIKDGVELSDAFCGGDDKAPKSRDEGECGGGLNGKWWPMADSDNQFDLAELLSEYAIKQYDFLFNR